MRADAQRRAATRAEALKHGADRLVTVASNEGDPASQREVRKILDWLATLQPAQADLFATI
jgi:hypothetical protein